MIESHERFSPGIPIIFCGSSEEMLERLKPDSHFTGVWGTVQPEETFKAALHLQPTTKHVVVVGGVGAYDRYLERIVKGSLQNYESKFEFTYLTDQDMPTLLGRLSRLPSDTIVLYTSIFQDAAGAHFIDANQSAPMVVGATNAPVFVLFDVNFGTGAVGGDLISFASDGKIAGQMAVSILNGEKLGDIPVVKNANVMMLDWRALRRWGFKESELPPGSVVSYRQLTVWESYKWYIISGISLILLEALLIGGLVWQRAERLKSKKAVRASEERLRLAQQAARIGTFEWNIQTGVNIWTPELEAMYGLPPGGFGGTQPAFENLVHPDDRAGVIRLVDAAMKSGQPTKGEWRVVWADGSVHWIAGHWQVFMHASGEPSRMIGVNIDVTERMQAEEARLEVNRTLEAQAALLQSREELLKIFVKHVPAAVAMLDRDMRYLQVSERWCADFSLDSSQILGRSHYEIFPDMPDRWKQIHRRALAGETLRAAEDRWDREGGTTWLRWEIRPWQSLEGVPGGILIFSEDITHRKNAEEALLGMSRKLIEAHEQERTRIGRDLHDDVVQRLALLSIELEGVQQDVPDAASELRTRIGAVRDQTTQITNDVQLLSHELHSSKLEYLGIVGAAKNFCKEFSERQKVEIDFQSHDAPTALPTELSLPLFRVLQEALSNATKHSGVKRFEVRVWGSTGEVHLTVSDLGAGFDTEAAMKSSGLGLTSMQERLRLVQGELSINSQPKGGTTIHARVPFDSTSDSARAAR
jgi:PAS domain S-box-containing protein